MLLRTPIGRILTGSIAFVSILVTVSVGATEPIGMITIRNAQDAATAREVVGTAFGRSSNKFLVSINDDQRAQLTAVGIEFESVIEDADPSDVYQILDMNRSPRLEMVEIDRLGTVNDLGHGLRIMSLTRAEAASVSNDPRLRAIPLTARSIRIFYPATSVASPLADEYPSDSLISRINQDSLQSYVQRLENFRTRYTFTDSCEAARDWLEQKFRSWGYTDVTKPGYYDSYLNSWVYNVQCVKPGVTQPEEYIVMGGHYDSWTDGQQSPGPGAYAPGADDDATGVALILEMARVLADVPLRKSIVFIPFDAEEVGLVGSAFAANGFASRGDNLEVMYNFDMVAFTDDPVWDLNYAAGDIAVYRNFSTATAARVSSLIPIVTSMGQSSDHATFDAAGFPIVDHIESDFNTIGWHTNADISSRLNFPYFKEVAKAALASVAVVADAAYPATVNQIADPGDGQSLQVSWSNCDSDCDYTVYWGTQPGVYVDSSSVPAGDCSFTIPALTDGVEYHILAVGTAPQGYRAFYGIEGSGTPYLYPRVPFGLAGSPSPNQMRLYLTWQPNAELDFSHYRVYRRPGTVGEWQLYQDGVTGTTFSDVNVLPHVGYEYAVTAVDMTGYESPKSSTVTIFPATYDGGPVVADGFVKDHDYDPDQAWQEAWLDTIFGPIGFSVAPSDENGGPVTLSTIGQYGTLVWIDDDVIYKNISQSNATLDEYSKHGTNMLISGYRTWFTWAAKSVPTSHLLYREFGLTSYDYTPYFDFIGAVGENGWPSVQIDRTRGMREWRDIAKLAGRPGSQVILRFDSEMDLPEWEGQPVGITYQTANGKRVLLAFPLYYLTPASATALMAKVFEYFAVTNQFDKGDLNHSGTVDIGDVSILIDHLFISLDPLAYPEDADMDGVHGVSIGDVMYLISYLFLGGPAPVPTGGTGTGGLPLPGGDGVH